MGATVEEHGGGKNGGGGALRAREVLGPSIRPAGVGALLGVLWFVVAVLPWDFDDLCHSDEPWGCLGFGLLMMAAVPLVTTVAGWVLLRVAGVRPAWRVAALGGVLALAAEYLFARSGGGSLLASYAMPLVMAAAYAAAAAVALPGAGSLRRWGVLAAALLLMWPLSAALGERSISAYTERQIAAAEVPLLAPELNDYRLYFPEADVYDGTFLYLLLPRPVETSAADREQRGVQVTVGPQIPGFAPPDVCEVYGSRTRVDAGPCEQVAPDTWRSSWNGSIRYIARREGVIVVLSGGGPTVSDEDLRAMAGSLTVRKPAFFVDPNG
ncbi:hypothetical protein [Streptomyces xanthophaeus]|uniref:hypothetical protein n=1 Tax=Streptomyces xanthophaeus TaxID=67385 RepID=UPI002647D7DF|nr:hypothetical protein [Streptomyces xanthophaeus]WKD30906.1 hypothetical protein KO717_02235 [Streptomyces xanthophaeus]